MIIDDALLEDCIAGKRNAQNALYRRFASTMMAVCLRYARNRSEAEDLMQEGFLKVFLNISSFRKKGSFEGWIKRIMINNALNHYRKNRKIPYHWDIEQINETEIEDQEEDTELQYPFPADVILSLIQALPEGYRMVFNLYVFEEYGHKEIAEMLSISENTSKTQLLKARRYLRRRLA